MEDAILDVDEMLEEGKALKEEITDEEILDSVEIINEDDHVEINEDVSDNQIIEEDKKQEVVSDKNKDKIDSLYSEFSSFLKNKTEIEPDSGIKNVIPTGIEVLDAVLGGGFAVGTFAIVVGQPGSGKSMLAIQAMAGAQIAYHGSIAAFLDSEEATTSIRMSNLGVRYPKINPYNDITVEKVFKFLEGLCLFKEEKKIVDVPSIVIWDSIANTLSEKERQTDDVNSVIGYKARVLSIVLPKYIAKLAKYNISLVAVNQLRDVIQMGPYSVPRDHKFMSGHKHMPGGNTIGFNAFTLLEMKTKKLIEADKYGFDGIKVAVKTVKNKLFTPNIEVMLSGDFRTGFSNFWTNYDFLVETKRLKTGAWNFLVNLPDKKFRTKDANILYKTEQIFKDAYDEAVKDAIQKDIIDKYNPEIL